MNKQCKLWERQFNSANELCKFVNSKKLTKDDIQKIIYRQEIAFEYELLFWAETPY